MSTVHVVLASVAGRADTGATMPCPKSQPRASDTVNSSATSSVTSLTGAAGEFWVIVATAAVWAKAGTGTPVAASDDGWYIPANTPMSFSVTTAGETFAFKDA